MAVLIPDKPKECPNGERIVYERVGHDLDQDAVALHSLGLVKHRIKLWGEADIVVITTKGIFVLEVKGGRVSCKDGVWEFWAPGRDSYTRKEDPWTQAKEAMYALKTLIAEKAPDLPEFLMGYGVVMPHEKFTATGAEIEPGVLLDKREFGKNLGFYIGRLSRHWEAVYESRHGRIPRAPTKDEIRRLRQILRPDVDSAYSLGSYFNGLEQELLLLTNGQIRAARGVAKNRRTVIRGKAGTGKTIIAIDHARNLASQGFSVLYICFNQLLARHVQLCLADDPLSERITVRHIHALYREHISHAGMSDQLQHEGVSDEEFFAEVFPSVFVDAALEVEPEPFDVLVIDEAQDILSPQNLDALELLLTDGLAGGRWHLFLDPLQNIYSKWEEATSERLREAGYADYELYENCRNTKPVAMQTSIVSGIDLEFESALEGPPCECVFYRDREDFLKKLDSEIRRLFADDVLPRDIVILSTRKLDNSMLSGAGSVAGCLLIDLSSEPGGEGIHFSTMHAFKGLERNVVIAVDLEHIGDELFAMLHYAGLSRARILLRPFVAEAEKNAYQKQATAFGKRVFGGGSH